MPVATTRLLASDPEGFDRDTWRRAAELGWTSLLAPASLGGGGLSDNASGDLAVVAEEMGRRSRPGPLLPVNVVVDTLARGGQPALVDEVVPGLMAGETIAAWALAESRDVWGVDGLGETVVGDEGDDLVVSGRKRFVEAAASADVILVSAMSAGGPTQVLVDADASGVTVVPGPQCRSRSPVRRSSTSTACACRRGPSSARQGDAAADIEHQCQLALALQVAETVGRLDHVYGTTVEYLAGSLVVRPAARVVPGAQAPPRRHAARARDGEGLRRGGRRCGRHRRALTRRETSASPRPTWAGRRSSSSSECVQLHGGIAMTWEHDLHLYERRAAVNRAVYGTPEYHEERLCALVEAGAV